MKIITIVGARPQFIKAAVVSRAVKKWNECHEEKVEEFIVHTGQHYDANMSEVFFQEMGIPMPKYNLHIGGGTHGSNTGNMLAKIEDVLLKEKPDVVLVYGDTDSTLAGALAAVKLHIPIAHVEAGLRSFNMQMPEEINRILTDRIATYLFAPTEKGIENLHQEGFKNFAVKMYNVGDVMLDASLFYRSQNKASENIKRIVRDAGEFYLATVHRAENTDNPDKLREIMTALEEIATRKSVILPVHPRTKRLLGENKIMLKNITAIEPVGYFDMLYLEDKCDGILTDSGGVQKEAFFFGKPCITLRKETEWLELVEKGYNQLAGVTAAGILEAEKKLPNMRIDDGDLLYGNGKAGEQILAYLMKDILEVK